MSQLGHVSPGQRTQPPAPVLRLHLEQRAELSLR